MNDVIDFGDDESKERTAGAFLAITLLKGESGQTGLGAVMNMRKTNTLSLPRLFFSRKECLPTETSEDVPSESGISGYTTQDVREMITRTLPMELSKVQLAGSYTAKMRKTCLSSLTKVKVFSELRHVSVAMVSGQHNSIPASSLPRRERRSIRVLVTLQKAVEDLDPGYFKSMQIALECLCRDVSLGPFIAPYLETLNQRITGAQDKGDPEKEAE